MKYSTSMANYCTQSWWEEIPVFRLNCLITFKPYWPCWDSSAGSGSSRRAWHCQISACPSHSAGPSPAAAGSRFATGDRNNHCVHTTNWPLQLRYIISNICKKHINIASIYNNYHYSSDNHNYHNQYSITHVTTDTHYTNNLRYLLNK